MRTFNQGGFNIEDVFNERYEQATIEFWIKPTSVRNWNQQIGPSWGKFMMHTTSSAELVVGWDTGNRITSAANTLRTGQWAHVAVVVNKGEMTAYVNGQSVGSISSGYSGLGGFGDLNVGLANSATASRATWTNSASGTAHARKRKSNNTCMPKSTIPPPCRDCWLS